MTSFDCCTVVFLLDIKFIITRISAEKNNLAIVFFLFFVDRIGDPVEKIVFFLDISKNSLCNASCLPGYKMIMI